MDDSDVQSELRASGVVSCGKDMEVLYGHSQSCELTGLNWAVLLLHVTLEGATVTWGTSQAGMSKMAHSHGLSAESSAGAVDWNIFVGFSLHSSWVPRGSISRASIQKGPGNQASYDLALVVSDVTSTIFCWSSKSLRLTQIQWKVN